MMDFYGGYFCGRCGQWVYATGYHICPVQYVTLYNQPVVTPLNDEIKELREEIKRLRETIETKLK